MQAKNEQQQMTNVNVEKKKKRNFQLSDPIH